MTTNTRDQLSDLVHDDKVLLPMATLPSAGMQTPFRNIPNQVPVPARISITGPPTPTHWLVPQQRMQSNPTKFDMNGQVQNNRFRERAVQNVPNILQYQLRVLQMRMNTPQAVIYMQNGQTVFGNSPNNMQVVGAPRLEHAHRNNIAPNGVASAGQPLQERPLKSVSGPGPTYDGTTMQFGNANTHVVVKSNTLNAVDGHATMPVPVRFVPVASAADANLARDRQFVGTVGRNGNSRPVNANWSNPNWTNQNNSASPNWSNSVAPNWVATNQDRSAPNWTGQQTVAGVAGSNPNSQVNWTPYAQGQSHAHSNHGHSQRNTQKGSRASRNTFAIAATTTTNVSVPVANQPIVVADSTGSAASHSSPPADATCSSSSPTGSAKIDSQSPSECGIDSAQPLKDECAVENSTEQLLPDTSLPTTEQLTSTSTSAASGNHVGQLIDTTSPSTDVSSLPDSASATQATELHSVSSSSASTSGIATPTRTSTSNKFGLTFGTEFSVEIDKIVNPNRPVPSVGVSISLNAISSSNGSAQTQRQVSLNNVAESSSSAPTSVPIPDAPSDIDVGTRDAPLATEVAKASESEKITANGNMPSGAQQQKQLKPNDQPNRNESSPYVVQLACELEKSFEDLQNKTTRAHKRVVRYAPQFTCFHGQQSDKSADAIATEPSGSSVPIPQVAASTSTSGTSALSKS